MLSRRRILRPFHASTNIGPVRFALAALLGIIVLPAGVCRAQHRWVVVALADDDRGLERALDVLDQASATLTAAGDGVVAPTDGSRAAIEARVSVPYREPPAALGDRLGRAAEAALEHVAFGRNHQALDIGQRLFAELEPHLPALGRNDAAARDLSNLCLYVVRAHVQGRDSTAALRQAEACVRLVPDLTVDERLHPPNVRELVAEVRARMETGDAGILVIRSDLSDPEGCAIRVNGRLVGRSPWARLTVPPGSYAVQVECLANLPGRVHTVAVGTADPARIVVHGRLSQALRTDRAIAIVYAGPVTDEEVSRDLAAVAAAVSSDRVLAVDARSAVISVRAFSIDDAESARLVGTAPVPEPIAAHGREAVRAAVSGRQLSAPAPPSVATTGTRIGRADVGIAVLGGSFVAVGLAGLGVSWYFWLELEARGREITAASEPGVLSSAQVAFDEARIPPLAIGGASATLATLGLPMLLPDEEGMPWWALVFGAAGLGVAAVGVYELAVEGGCYANADLGTECSRRWPSWVLGTLVLEHASPLLAIPLTYLVRLATGGSRATSATLDLQPNRAMLAVSGRF